MADLTMYTTSWCGFCRRLKLQLDEAGIAYREVDIERGNDDAVAGVVVIKRRATADPGDQVVAMTLRDLVALLTGERP